MFRKLVKYGFLIVSITFAVVQACCRLIPSLNPFEFSIVGVMPYAVPILTVINLVFLVFWFITKKYYFMLIPGIAILISWNVLSVLIGGHPFASSEKTTAKQSFTVMSYNVRLLDLYNWSGKKDTRKNMLDFFKKQSPDILCLQEFYSGNDSVGKNNIKDIQAQGYPYVANCVMNENKRGTWGSVVFSKLPIVHRENHDIDVVGGNLLQEVGIRLGKDTFTVFNVHLKSNKFSSTESELVEKKEIPSWDDKTKAQTKSIYDKLEKSSVNRGLEAELIGDKIQRNKFPVIVCGDLNDIPGSYAYFKLRHNLRDLFLEKGFGFGATYNKIIPVLRIDYIFFDPSFEVFDYQKPEEAYSDHFPIVGRFGLNRNDKKN